jgi:hypothetical protein
MAALPFTGYRTQIALAPDGQATAFLGENLSLWRGGEVIAVPYARDIAVNRQPGFAATAQPGLAWGPTAWRIRTDRPEFSAPPPTIAAAPADCDPPTRLTVGISGAVTPGQPVALYHAPGMQNERAGEIPGFGIFAVLDGPECVDGSQWWQVNYNGIVAWAAEGRGRAYWLEPLTCAGALPGRLMPNTLGAIIGERPRPLRVEPNLREENVAFGQIPPGGVFTVLRGPECSREGLIWWHVDYQGTEGWIAEANRQTYWLEPWQG